MADVFMSYSSKNNIEAMALCSSLEEQGLSVWIAPRDIPAGSEYGEEIIKGIEGSRVFLLCLSKESVQSQHVLREVERAVNRNMKIIVYQMEETPLSKSLEYFLASTQWFIPSENRDKMSLADSVKRCLRETVQSFQPENSVGKIVEEDFRAADTGKEEATSVKEKKGKRLALKLVLLFIAILIILGGVILSLQNKTPEIAVGDTFKFGSLDLTGDSLEPITWMVLSVDEEADTALCITEDIIAFGPYDGAESGMRGKAGEIYYQEDNLSEYTQEQLMQFWGSSDWDTSGIRSWLNSAEATVSYVGQAPTEDTTSLYENEYAHKEGFLYTFTESEKEVIIPKETKARRIDGEEYTTTDNVFLLSKEETEQYFSEGCLKLSAAPTQTAVQMEGTGVYADYKEQGNALTFWALRDAGDIPACTILCAGEGMRYEEEYHSEYACSSLIGIRPAIVLPISELENRVAENMEK